MKIGVLTYHFSINWGAVLQCYALREALQMQGHDAYVINFVSEEQADNIALYRKNNNLKSVLKNVLLLPFHRQRRKRNNLFESFVQEKMNATKRVTNYGEFIKLQEEERFDAIFVGSDQVWNPRIKDFNDIFFLKGIKNTKKIGYAVSLGEAGYSDLLPYEGSIKTFDIVSVREESAATIIRKLYDGNVLIAMDPTFLLSNSHWMELSTNNKHSGKPYSIAFFLNKEKYEQNLASAKAFSDRNGLDMILLDMRVSKTSIKYKGLISVGPQEFLQYIGGASCVLTDSFHGTVFSILLNRPFYSINNNPNSTDTRRSELLAKFSLKKYYIPISALSEMFVENYDCVKVNKALEDIRIKSIELIRNMLN